MYIYARDHAEVQAIEELLQKPEPEGPNYYYYFLCFFSNMAVMISIIVI